MAFEIDYKFNPGETVYVVNRGTFSVHKGKVYRVQIKSFKDGDGLGTSIWYSLSLEDKTGGDAVESDVFETFDEATNSLLATPTPTVTRTITPTPTVTRTPTHTASRTPTPSPTLTQTVTPTVTASIAASPTATPTRTPVATRSPTPSVTATATPNVSLTPSVTSTVTATPGVSPTPSVTVTGTPVITPSPTTTVTGTPSPTTSLTPTPTATVTNSVSVTPTSSAVAATATPTPTATPTMTPSGTPAALTDFNFVSTRVDSDVEAFGMAVQSVAYSPTLGISVAVGANVAGPAPVNIVYSSDGINWNAAPINWTASVVTAVTWNSDLGMFTALSNNNTTLFSSDGIDWQELDNNLDGQISIPAGRFEYVPAIQKYVVVGYPDAKVYTSDDGTVWDMHDLGFNLFGLASSDTALVLYGTGQANYAYTTDGMNFANLWLQGKNITAMAYNPVDNTFNGIVTDQMTGDPEWITSNDGIVWSSIPIASWPFTISYFMGPQNWLTWSEILGGYVFNSSPNSSVAISRNGTHWDDMGVAPNDSTSMGRMTDHLNGNVILIATCCDGYNNVLVGFNVNFPPVLQATPTPTPTPSVTPSTIPSLNYLALMGINDNGQLYVTDINSVSGFGAVDQLVDTVFPDTNYPVGVNIGNRVHIISYNETFDARSIVSYDYDANGLNLSSQSVLPLPADINSVSIQNYNGKLLVIRGMADSNVFFDVYTDTGTALTLDYSTQFTRTFLSRETYLEMIDDTLVTISYNESIGSTWWRFYTNSGTEFVEVLSHELTGFLGAYPNTYTGTHFLYTDFNELYALPYNETDGFGTSEKKFDPNTFYPGVTVGWAINIVDGPNRHMFVSYSDLDDDEKHLNVFTWDDSFNLTLITDETDTAITDSASGGRLSVVLNGFGFGNMNIPFNGIQYNGTTFSIVGEKNIDGFFNIAGHNIILLN